MTKNLAILGCGGHGKVVADAAMNCSQWQDIAFFDDKSISGYGPWKMEGTYRELLSNVSSFSAVIVAIGDNSTRLEKTKELYSVGTKIATIIHPAAVVSQFSEVSEGTVIFAGAIVNAGAKIGLASIVNTGSVVEHDCCLGDAVHISPNATLSGETKVGACSWIGAGAVTRQKTRVGDNCVVGAGSVVVSSVSSGDTVVGNPAKPIKY